MSYGISLFCKKIKGRLSCLPLTVIYGCNFKSMVIACLNTHYMPLPPSDRRYGQALKTAEMQTD